MEERSFDVAAVSSLAGTTRNSLQQPGSGSVRSWREALKIVFAECTASWSALDNPPCLRRKKVAGDDVKFASEDNVGS